MLQVCHKELTAKELGRLTHRIMAEKVQQVSFFGGVMAMGAMEAMEATKALAVERAMEAFRMEKGKESGNESIKNKSNFVQDVGAVIRLVT